MLRIFFSSSASRCLVICGVLGSALLTWNAAAASPSVKKVLVGSVTTGYRHASIETAERVLQQLATDSGKFSVDFVHQPPGQTDPLRRFRPGKSVQGTSEYQQKWAAHQATIARHTTEMKTWLPVAADPLKPLHPDNLARYDGVIFASTTGDLPLPDRDGFITWVREGNAFIGFHAAADTFHNYAPYLEMLGGEFLTHGAQVHVECLHPESRHPAVGHLPSRWGVFDEIYKFQKFEPATVDQLLIMDRHPQTQIAGSYPVAWCKRFEAGRVFYTSLGHRPDVWDPEFKTDRKNTPAVAEAYQQHILHGILWALDIAPA